MPEKWSSVLSDEFSITLTPELQSWYDEGPLEPSVNILFGEPIHPEELIDTGSNVIWGGQMPPDTLPILGDGCGNTISLRFDASGSLSELIHWNHDSGQWAPYGRSLSQAILFDALSTDENDAAAAINHAMRSPIVEWALRWSRTSAGELLSLLQILRARVDYTPLFQGPLPVVAMCNLIVEDTLRTRLEHMCRGVGGQSIAGKLRTDVKDLLNWLRNPSLIPQKHRKKLARICDCTDSQLLFQDWQNAVAFSRRCLDNRIDLSWPYHVLAEYWLRQGNTQDAIDCLLKALPLFATTASFTSEWESWSLPDKYSAKKLLGLMPLLSDETKNNPYFQAAMSKEPFAVYEYWRASAQRLDQLGDSVTAYKSWYAAGWDCYCTNHMSDIVEALARTSKKAGCTALNKIALRHQSTM